MMKTQKVKRNPKNKTLKKEKCSPQKDKILNFTCYTPKKLQKLKRFWNIRHPDVKITSKNPRIIWEKLKKNMGSVCDSEKCWLNQSFIKHNLDRELLHYTFAPNKPREWKKNPNEWLSSLEIIDVMKQYENAYPSFTFIGPSPIDYDTHKLYGECVWEELCKFNLKSHLTNGKTKIGIVFNTDPHYLEGSHWFAVFIDCKKGEIYYFDSYGDEPETQIIKLVNTIIEQSKKIQDKPYTFMVNNKRHQYSDSECGMYSLYFIITMLKGMSWSSFNKNRIPDKKMKELRSIYFS